MRSNVRISKIKRAGVAGTTRVYTVCVLELETSSNDVQRTREQILEYSKRRMPTTSFLPSPSALQLLRIQSRKKHSKKVAGQPARAKLNNWAQAFTCERCREAHSTKEVYVSSRKSRRNWNRGKEYARASLQNVKPHCRNKKVFLCLGYVQRHTISALWHVKRQVTANMPLSWWCGVLNGFCC